MKYFGLLALAVLFSARTVFAACTISATPMTHTWPEGAGTLPITYTRSGDSAGQTCIQISADAAHTTATSLQDYYLGTGQICWQNGDMDPKIRNIVFYTDDKPEGTEILTANIQAISGACTAPAQPIRVTIADDDYPSLLGDYDKDCDVDGADLMKWQRELGSTAEPYTGSDGSGNGIIDSADRNVWSAQFGKGCIKGDMDFNRLIDNDDWLVFSQAMTQPEQYEKRYGYSPVFAGDFNNDNKVTNADYTGFGAVQAKRPTVNAGPDKLLRLPHGLSIDLNGSAISNSGSNQPLVAEWTLFRGDVAPVIASPANFSTKIDFKSIGYYVLRLTVRDDIYVGYDDAVVDVQYTLLQGDYDGDCDVDGSDFMKWQQQLGNTVVPHSATDGNGDGVINSGDREIWSLQFGKTCPPLPLPVLPGDFDGNCHVDGADMLKWQRELGNYVNRYDGSDASGNGFIDSADRAIWSERFGESCPAAAEAPVAALMAEETVTVSKAKFYPSRNEMGRIEFTLNKPTAVRILIQDRRGYQVAELMNSTLSAGSHGVDWNGAGVAAGMYSGILYKDGHPTRFKFVVIK